MPTMTAAQKRAQSKTRYDAFLAACPSHKLLDRLSEKWVALILCALRGHESAAPQAMRYSELSRTVAGASQKMLTQTLRALERDGLVVRDVEPTVPVTVRYALTDLGRSLYEVLGGLKAWAEANMDDVLAHREAYDEHARDT